MISMNFIELNNRKLPQYLLALFLNIVSIYCLGQNPVVSCPATFSDGHIVYRFKNARVFDGPVELNAELKPEFKKDKQYWKVFGTKYDPFLICTYAKLIIILFLMQRARTFAKLPINLYRQDVCLNHLI